MIISAPFLSSAQSHFVGSVNEAAPGNTVVPEGDTCTSGMQECAPGNGAYPVSFSLGWHGGPLAVFSLLVAASSFSQPLKRIDPPIVRTVTMDGCSFRFTDSLGGVVDDNTEARSGPYVDYRTVLRRHQKPVALSIDLACAPEIPNGCDDFVGADRTASGSVEWNTLDQTPHPEVNRVEVNQLRSVNGLGVLRVESDATGDDGSSASKLSFCLRSPRGSALYGVLSVDATDGERAKVTSEVTQLLRTIEFVDGTNSSAIATQPAATSSARLKQNRKPN